MMSRLDHPHVRTVLDSGRQEGIGCLAMESNAASPASISGRKVMHRRGEDSAARSAAESAQARVAERRPQVEEVRP
jgi:hypothetical protein